MDPVVMQTELPGLPVRRGKVRDLYDLGDRLVIVATDRISAFDWVMPSGIPGKGKLLTAMTRFWLEWLGEPHHLLSTSLRDFPAAFQVAPEIFADRSMLVRKTRVIPFECVARGYLAGSGWKEYRQSGTVCGIPLPGGLRESDPLPEAIFTPATKAESGHDENISFSTLCEKIGEPLATELRERTLAIYRRAAAYAGERGIIIADTKLEWGHDADGTLLLIDEVLTPDSSRFWPRERYTPGISPPSFDKQLLRDWLESIGWDKNSPPPELPDWLVGQLTAKYQETVDRLLAG
jgi:phosphoribosylaminoimidazole-succinocarboxamide synthase